MAEQIRIEFSDEAEPGLRQLGKTAARTTNDMDALAKAGKRVGDSLADSAKSTRALSNEESRSHDLRSSLLSMTDRLFIAINKVAQASRVASIGIGALAHSGTDAGDRLSASFNRLGQSLKELAAGPTGSAMADKLAGWADAIGVSEKKILAFPEKVKMGWATIRNKVPWWLGGISDEVYGQQMRRLVDQAKVIEKGTEENQKALLAEIEAKAVAHDRVAAEQEIKKLKDQQHARENQTSLERALNSRVLRQEEKEEHERIKRLLLEENELKRKAAKLSEEEGKKLLEQAADLARRRANATRAAEAASARAYELERKRAQAIEDKLKAGTPGSTTGLPPVKPRPQIGLLGSGFEQLATYRGQPTYRRTGSSIDEAYQRMQARGDRQTGTDELADAIVKAVNPKEVRREAVRKAIADLESKKQVELAHATTPNEMREIIEHYRSRQTKERNRLLHGIGRGPDRRGITGDEIADAQTALTNAEITRMQEKGKVDAKTVEVLKKQTQTIIQNGATLKSQQDQLDQLQAALTQYLRTSASNNRTRAQVAGLGN